ncbi:hypothetical protein DL240_16470 [Lujinxingia litoralis]|uniref:Aminoglycoside phosphotransferase domain-containing protein n=1 Tax=Lujinxingia litoralis TaxID=2211119 RepID=A0A328C7U0_9DELT|nr:phosphotransferase [Lujinxingia litoralis]RAL20625.1 hypothetical protein DL240_16470 [Lujinxingia litoralis]
MNFDEPAIRQHIAQHLNVAADTIAFIRGFENIVFRQSFVAGAPREPAARILRLTEPSHRSRGQLQAEAAWVLDLAERGVPVARPLPWHEDDLIEELVVDGTRYWAMAFELAPGKAVDSRDAEVWNAALFETWGETLALLHLSARDYQVPAGQPRRPRWDEDDLMGPERYLAPADEAVIEACHAIFHALSALPADDADFGLVHNDFHIGNFFVDRGRITLFDFDDACYHWFANDIATALYSPCWWSQEGDVAEQRDFARSFTGRLLRGYRRHRELPGAWLEALPLLLRYRDALTYTVIHKRMDVSALDARLERELAACRARLLGGPARVEIDFQSF